MPKYNVYMHTTVSFVATVDAEDEDEARDLAYNETPYLCAQCSGWGRNYSAEYGEWEFDEDRDYPAVVKVEDDAAGS